MKNNFTKESEYTILMFLNIKEDSLNELKKIDLFGDKLDFVSWDNVNNLDIADLWKEIKFNKPLCPILLDLPIKYDPYPNTRVFSPISMKIKTLDHHIAVEIASERIDLLRSVLNTPSVIGSHLLFHSDQKPLSKILPTPIYVVFNNDGKRIETYYTIEKFEYEVEKIPVESQSSIKFLLNKFLKFPKPNSIWHHIYKILIQYQYALDTTSLEAAYLGMWQVLENSIRFNEENIRNQEIKSRISILLNCDPLSKEMLTILTNKRNDFVHLGKLIEYDDRSFFTLKTFTDFVIRKIISLSNHFDSIHELKEYFSLSSLSNNDLENKKKVIEIIKEFRKKD